ncbi:MAG: NADH-quinone oxidoreductase subunit C [Thermoprotei archaeon]
MSSQPQSQPQPQAQPQTQAQQKQQESYLAKKLEELKAKVKVNVKVESDRRATVEAEKANLVAVARVMKELGFDHVKTVTAIDYPETETFEVLYHVSSYGDMELAKTIVTLKTKTSYKDPTLPSLYSVWESVWTGERETYEMYGIKFEGHPDMRRLFLDEDFEGVYPMRKSYKVKLEGLFVDRPA